MDSHSQNGVDRGGRRWGTWAQWGVGRAADSKDDPEKREKSRPGCLCDGGQAGKGRSERCQHQSYLAVSETLEHSSNGGSPHTTAPVKKGPANKNITDPPGDWLTQRI